MNPRPYESAPPSARSSRASSRARSSRMPTRGELPHENFGGGAIYPLPGWPGPEPRPRRSLTHHGCPKEIGHGLPSLQIRHGLPSPRIRHGFPSLQWLAMASRVPGSAMASRTSCPAMASWASCPAMASRISSSALDAFPVSMSSTDIQGAHPPSPVLLLCRGTRRQGGGGNVTEWPVSSITDHFHLHLITYHAHLLLITTVIRTCIRAHSTAGTIVGSWSHQAAKTLMQCGPSLNKSY